MPKRGSVVGGLTLVLAVMSVGCASSSPSSKARVSSSTMSRAHGGAYNATTKSCTYTAMTRSAKETCEAHHGYYDTAADVCEIGQE